jgi:hypothetical protein
MAYSIYLSGSSFNAPQWAEAMQSLLESGEEWKLLPLGETLLEEGLLPHALVLLDGSSRGVYVDQEEDGRILVEMVPFASRMDWAFLFRLVWEAAERGAEIEEDADYLAGGFGAGRVEAAFAHWWELSSKGMFEPLRSGCTCTLPTGGRFSIPLLLEDTALERDVLEAAMTSRVRRYASAHSWTVIGIERTNGEVHEVSTWGPLDSLIQKNAGYVTLKLFVEDDAPGEVAMADFVEVMAEVIEDAGQAWYLPEMNQDHPQHAALLAALKSRAVSLSGGDSDSDGDHTEEYALILSDAPVCVFFLIAASDGEVERKEIKVFTDTLTSAAESGAYGELFSQAAVSVAGDFMAAVERVSAAISEEQGMLKSLLSIAGVLSGLPDEVAVPFKQGLYHIAEKVARSSGGLFSKVSKSEAESLKALKGILGLN